MKKTNLFMLFLALLVMVGCVQPSADAGTKQGNGRVVFAITDAAADMGTVTNVKVTVESIKVRSATEGWIIVSSTPKEYDLLELKAESKQELLADTELKPGNYTEIRLEISKVMVTDANGSHEAKLPSNELKIKSDLVVEADSTTAVTFDFMADESLHMTGNNRYIMAPVVQVETREDTNVELTSGNKVEITGGRVRSSVKISMDIEGNVGVGLKIPANANLSIDASGLVKIEDKGSGKIKIGIG